MAMELYSTWRRAGEPEQPLGLPLSFFAVNFHSFKSNKSRQEILWSILRPGLGKGGQEKQHKAIEKDSGVNTYK